MLSLFPQILFLAPFSAFLIRFALFCLLTYAGWNQFGKSGLTSRIWGVLQMVAAILLLAGAWIQLIAVVVFLALIAELFIAQVRTYPKSTIMLALVMCLSLLVTGAGAIAFDLPL